MPSLCCWCAGGPLPRGSACGRRPASTLGWDIGENVLCIAGGSAVDEVFLQRLSDLNEGKATIAEVADEALATA